jgi:hypothetical protein
VHVTLSQFLLRLASDPELFEKFAAAPNKEDFLREQEVDEHALHFLLSGNLRNIRVHIQAELEIDGDFYSIGTVHTVTVHAASDSPEGT